MSVIHPLRLRYSNAYLVVGERPILVDTGSRGDAPTIVAGCAGAGVKIRDLALILHTHVHSDHFGNTAELAARSGRRNPTSTTSPTTCRPRWRASTVFLLRPPGGCSWATGDR